MSLPELGVFLIPPLVGSVIGLFTNWLAIKMLFRPLAEKRLLGLRVPFTPGILPRERERMARSLGETVAVDLLDERTVSERLRSRAFKDAVGSAAFGLGKKALEAKPGDLVAGLDGATGRALRDIALELLSGVASSGIFARSVSAGAGAALAASEGLRLSALVPASAVGTLSESLSGPEGGARTAVFLSETMMGAFEAAATEGKAVSDIVGADRLAALAEKAVEAAYPAVVEAVVGMMADRKVAASMEKAAARVIRRALDRFNSVQRFFISLGQYDKAIMESMPATIADLGESMRDILSEPSTKAAVTAKAAAAARSFAERPLSSFGFMRSAESREAARRSLNESIGDALARLEPRALADMIGASLDRASLGGIIEAVPGAAERIGPALARWLSGLSSKRPPDGSAAGAIAAAFFAAFSSAFGSESSGAPLFEAVSISDEALGEIAASAADGLSELAAAESGEVLRSIDIRSLVVDKIDSLDMIEVERMILKVVDKELGAITMFGGILGAVIGLFQSLLFMMR